MNCQWQEKDTERAVWHLRVQMMSLLALKRLGHPPQGYEQFQILMDKLQIDGGMHIDDDDDDDGQDMIVDQNQDDRPDDNADRPQKKKNNSVDQHRRHQ
jgi:hypothetical protein